MSRIVDFYRGEIENDEGFKIDQILNWGLLEWEASHLSIQWIFPTVRPSQFNPDAPTLDRETVEAFNADVDLKIKFHEALSSWFRAYGLEFVSGGPGVDPIFKWKDSPGLDGTTNVGLIEAMKVDSKAWLKQFNHNHLRITRILECLRYLGFENYSRVLFHKLTGEDGVEISGNTYQHWRNAAYGELP